MIRSMTRRDALRWLGLAGGLLSGCAGTQEESPMPQEVNGCRIDPDRLAPLRPCMECCGPQSPRDEWNHSCVHPRTVAYSCGRLAYLGGPNAHDHDPAEAVRCRRLADEAARILVGVNVGGCGICSPAAASPRASTRRPRRAITKHCAWGRTSWPPTTTWAWCWRSKDTSSRQRRAFRTRYDSSPRTPRPTRTGAMPSCVWAAASLAEGQSAVKNETKDLHGGGCSWRPARRWNRAWYHTPELLL